MSVYGGSINAQLPLVGTYERVISSIPHQQAFNPAFLIDRSINWNFTFKSRQFNHLPLDHSTLQNITLRNTTGDDTAISDSSYQALESTAVFLPKATSMRGALSASTCTYLHISSPSQESRPKAIFWKVLRGVCMWHIPSHSSLRASLLPSAEIEVKLA